MFVEALFGRAPNWKNPNVFQWLVKQTVEQLYHGILVSNKKERVDTCTTWMNLKGIMLHEKKPIPKGYVLQDSIYIIYLK